ncbi:hypothetical protein BSKO_11048 [Bryopsis sp. KO-2023]|nr:hypothetical protein BSKO_11048 [Bryopsis sp. KO-2023]
MDWRSGAKAAAIGCAAAATVVAVPAIALPAAGFSAGGVVAGSLAATWQASIGNVAAGSIFAALQSAGTAAVINGVTAPLAAGVGAVVGMFSKKQMEKDQPDGKEGEGNVCESCGRDPQRPACDECNEKEQPDGEKGKAYLCEKCRLRQKKTLGDDRKGEEREGASGVAEEN